MDIIVDKFANGHNTSTFFPPLDTPTVSQSSEQRIGELLRTDYLGNNERGLLASMVEQEFATYDVTDHEQVSGIACGIYCENRAIASLFVAQKRLQHYHYDDILTHRIMPSWAHDLGLKPHYSEWQLDFNYYPFIDKSKAENYGGTINQMVDRMLESMGIDVEDVVKKAQAKNKKLMPIVVTDLVIASHLNTTSIEAYVVGSPHEAMKQRAFLSFALVNDDGTVDVQATFGNLLYTPSRRFVRSDSRGNGTVSKTFTKFIGTLPILAVLCF